jgi:hypothetical protein
MQTKLIEQGVFTSLRLYNGVVVERNQSFPDMVAEHMAAGMYKCASALEKPMSYIIVVFDISASCESTDVISVQRLESVRVAND